jgi:hypothetical protein
MIGKLEEPSHATSLQGDNVTKFVGVMKPAPLPSHTLFLIDLPPEAASQLNQLMAQTGDNPTELFHKALALYKVTKDAIQEGKSVGIAETADCLEYRFVGL